MSAIDFTMEIGRQPDPAGDRVKIDITGKFLKYKGLVTVAPLPPSRHLQANAPPALPLALTIPLP